MNSTPFESLTEKQIERYSRQIILKDVGVEGTKKLLAAKVGVVGAGGLGCPAVQMLASAGVGTIRIIDGDIVDLSNLPRQILHFTHDVGLYKVDSIAAKVHALNPDISIETRCEYLTRENVAGFLDGLDYVIEASDRFATKYLVNDACVFHNIPFTIAGVVEFMGQVLTILPDESACYRCIFPEPKKEDNSNNCSGAGVMNTVPSFAGLLQANEALKSICGLPLSYINRIFVFDLMHGSFDYVPIKRSGKCFACADIKSPYYLSNEYSSEPTSCRF
jgi:molybdopterin/thiamine biosynthesis adenylyltransferase